MTTAIRTLAIIALASAVPLIALWFATQRIIRLDAQCGGCYEFGGFYEALASGL